MSMTDPVADMLTRIRNAQMRHKNQVTTPASKLRERVLDAQAAAQPNDVLGAVIAGDAFPTGVLCPVLLQCGNFLATLVHEFFLSVSWMTKTPGRATQPCLHRLTNGQ